VGSTACINAPSVASDVPPASQRTQVIYLEQGWNPQERQAFYHKAQGTLMFPYNWFMALEQLDSTELFRTDTNLERYGLIPDPDNLANNPDQLPVGFTRTGTYLGLNCAACHTGQLKYTGNDRHQYTIRIDGGPSMENNLGFVKSLTAALGATVGLPPGALLDVTLPDGKLVKTEECYAVPDNDKFTRFAAKVNAGGDKAALRHEVCDALKNMALPFLYAQRNGIGPTLLFPTDWGFGRIDAFGRGTNSVFMKLDPNNVRVMNAPISIPSLWGTWQYDWIQWNGSIQNQMARGIAEAIGVGATVFSNPDNRWDSSVDTKALAQLSSYVEKLKSPPWPKEFPSVDVEQAATGKQLYGSLCARCHAPQRVEDLSGTHLVMYLSGLEEIGTDPGHAFNFYARKVNAEPLLGKGTMSGADATQYVTTEIMKAKKLDPTPNEWRAPLAYVARPLNGVWATAPYLHNGSVPNLYQLLLPATKRDSTFCVGSREFDPVYVGFKTGKEFCAKDEVQFNTAFRGNANSGHEFVDADGCNPRPTKEGKGAVNGILGCELSDADRWAIIEYLKTL
jgi:mono/diheme cytochrome c family protein